MPTRPVAPRPVDLANLNDRQRQAVLHDEGALLVLAGAGSGKTRVITHRIARLIADGVAPQQLLGVTFTNKAAREMRERVRQLVGPRAREVTLATFHALALTMLKEEYAAVGLQKGFCVYDTSDQLGLIRELMRNVKVADRRLDAMRVLQVILKTKRERRQEVSIDWGDDYEFAAYELYPRYLEQMQMFNAVDFDDLLLRACDLMDIPEVRARWSQRYHYIMVDEYQDTSPDQLRLLTALSECYGNVCAVGDDDQSIYAWRGAAADNILRFARHFGGATEVILDQNYRSTGNILDVANAVIRNNKVRKAKRLWTADSAGEPVEVVACQDGEDEASFVAETIGQLVFKGVSEDDIAILYRSNTQSQVFEEALGLEHIPYQVVGGQAFYDRKEVRDALAFMSVLVNSRDEVSLRRIINVPPRGVGAVTVQRLVEASGDRGLWSAVEQAATANELPSAARHGLAQLVSSVHGTRRRLELAQGEEVAEVVSQYLDEVGLRGSLVDNEEPTAMRTRRLDNLAYLVDGVKRFAISSRARQDPFETLTDYLVSASLVRDEDDPEADAPQVTLMTLHGAKGLEFPYVFFVGMEEDLLPHRRVIDEGNDLTEERRLCYVGMTRARQRLWLVWARARVLRGQRVPRTPSRFLDELGDSLGVVRRNRGDESGEPDADLAQAFFERMRAQLGIEEDV